MNFICFKFYLPLLILIFIKNVNCKKDLETLRIRLNTQRQRSLFSKFKSNYSNFINRNNESSNFIITSSDPKISLKLKNYLYNNKIAFNEIPEKSPDYRDLEVRSTPFPYGNKHMTYVGILKMLINWKNMDSKENNKIELLEIGRTLKNRPIVVAKISDRVNFDHNKTKNSIFIESGIHAREYASIDTALYIMNEMIFNPDYEEVLKKYVFHFLVVMNPDGYIYTWTTNRWWRKNLRPLKKCFGVDLNRNFDINFGPSTQNGYCADDYKGQKPFSEEESKAERDYIEELVEDGNKIDLFLAFHSYGQQITYPYGYSAKKENEKILKQVTKNLELYNGIGYSYGQTYHVIYQASGGSDDWCAFNNYSRFTFIMELRDKGDYGFFLPEEKIEEVALDGLVTLNTIMNYLSPGIVKINKTIK